MSFTATPVENRLSLSEIKEQLNASPASALSFIMKEGRLSKNEFRAGDVRGTSGNSFMFNIQKLTGSDFGDNGGRGYRGVYDVYVAHTNGDQAAAIKLAKEYLGLPERDRPVPKTDRLARPTDKGEWKAITPVPPDAGMPDFHRMTPQGAKAVAAWPYRDEAGNVLFYVARFDLPDGRKMAPQISYGHNDHPGLRWKMKGSGLNTMFGREQLAARPDAPVLVVEGEKTAIAGRKMFSDHVVVSWVGGAKNALHVNYEPLKGRRVTFLADADQPGELAMRQAEKRALKAGADSTRVVIPPLEFRAVKEGWDLADRLPSGWTAERLRDLIVGPDRRIDVEHHARGIIDTYRKLGPQVGGKAALEKTMGLWSERISQETLATRERSQGFVEATLRSYAVHRRAGLSSEEARVAAVQDMAHRLDALAPSRSARFQGRGQGNGLSL